MQENVFQRVRNQTFSGGACPRTHLDSSHAFGARPNLKHLPTACHVLYCLLYCVLYHVLYCVLYYVLYCVLYCVLYHVLCTI